MEHNDKTFHQSKNYSVNENLDLPDTHWMIWFKIDSELLMRWCQSLFMATHFSKLLSCTYTFKNPVFLHLLCASYNLLFSYQKCCHLLIKNNSLIMWIHQMDQILVTQALGVAIENLAHFYTTQEISYINLYYITVSWPLLLQRAIQKIKWVITNCMCYLDQAGRLPTFLEACWGGQFYHQCCNFLFGSVFLF